jgi:ABC-type multidrug transport system ATPase subunit
MDEADLCDRISLIQDGAILKTDLPQNIASGFGRKLFEIKADKNYSLLKSLEKYPTAEGVFSFGKGIHFTSHDPNTSVKKLEEYLLKNKHHAVEVQEIRPGTEDVFMQLMQNQTSRET